MKIHQRFGLFFCITYAKIVGQILQFPTTKNRKEHHRSAVIMSVAIAFYHVYHVHRSNFDQDKLIPCTA